jgi:hypothetical protein
MMVAIYNHATYDAERRQALDGRSNWLVGFVGERPVEDVALREGVAGGMN